MPEDEKYQKFVEHMDNPFLGWTESEHKLPMIMSLLTPEDADFLARFPLGTKSPEEIAEAMDMTLEDLEPLLQKYGELGVIYASIRGDSIRYRILDQVQMFLRMPYWHGKETEELKKTAHHANAYMEDGWYKPFDALNHNTLRAVPINRTIEDTRSQMPFEDIMQIIDDYEYYTVSYCPCRIRHKLNHHSQDTSHLLETCLHFDTLGRHIVKHGLGREITKQETIEILEKAAKDGLVHGVSNHVENPDTICNCDPMYCIQFRPYHVMGFKQAMDKSNYQTKLAAADKCKACATCAKLCPMDAIQLQVNREATNKFNKAVTVNSELCVGCGVCVHKCPTGAITLERRAETTEPPRTGRDYVNQMMTDIITAHEARSKQ
jgi:formate hydrogenlyase subunit 6/NADH:ubiquinone oxidoreductase subunit I